MTMTLAARRMADKNVFILDEQYICVCVSVCHLLSSGIETTYNFCEMGFYEARMAGLSGFIAASQSLTHARMCVRIDEDVASQLEPGDLIRL